MIAKLNINLNKPWDEMTFVAFDTETSGQYPIADEIVEVGLIKWQNGKEIDSYQTLVKPNKPMGEEVIKIHGITNEMVENSPKIDSVISKIYSFMDNSITVAHHAPFDLGFFAWYLEEHRIGMPNSLPLCSSLLSRNVIKGSENHRLQTLIKFLGLPQGQAHRALDDARACMAVTLHCMNLVGPKASMKQIYEKQGKDLQWANYSIYNLMNRNAIRSIIEAIKTKKDIEFIYNSGTQKNKIRRATPLGIVRNPDGDFMPAFCFIDQKIKRFYINKITEAEPCN